MIKVNKNILLLTCFLLFLVNFFVVSSSWNSELFNVNELDFSYKAHECSFFSSTDFCSNLFIESIFSWNHLPLFFVFQKAFMLLFGTTKFSLLFFSFLISSCLVVCLFYLIFRLTSYIPALFSSLLYIFSFFPFQYAREIEENLFFSFMLLLTLMLFYFYYFSQNNSFLFKSNKYYYYFLLSFFLLSFTHNYVVFIFILFSIFFAILFFMYYKKNTFKSFFSFFLLFISSSIGVFFAVYNALQYSFHSGFAEKIPLFLPVESLLQGVKFFFELLSISQYSSFFILASNPWHIFGELILFCVFLVFCLLYFFRSKIFNISKHKMLFYYFVCFLFFGSVLLTFISPTSRPKWHTFAYFFPMFYILIGIGCYFLLLFFRKRYKLFVYVLLFLLLFVKVFFFSQLIATGIDFDFSPSPDVFYPKYLSSDCLYLSSREISCLNYDFYYLNTLDIPPANLTDCSPSYDAISLNVSLPDCILYEHWMGERDYSSYFTNYSLIHFHDYGWYSLYVYDY